jgi:hypothetical protein
MEWFVFAAPIPGPVEFTVGGTAVFAVSLAIALTPVALTIRHALGLGTAVQSPQLRVIEGGKDVRQQAA